MNKHGWIVESRTALYVKGSTRRSVYISHSRRLLDGRREYLCHEHTPAGIETFEASERDLRFM